MTRSLFQLAILLLSAGGTNFVLADGPIDARPDFTKDVLPILTQHCFACHGPDAESRQADLRLDQPDALYQPSDGQTPIIQPESASGSRLYRRLIASDPDQRMPPPEHGDPLSLDEIATIKRWIDSGAAWRGHWAFEPIAAPKIPSGFADWSDQPIDRLIAAKWSSRGLSPAAPADREMLLRRVTFALTGLPPTAAEIAAFQSDQRPRAYERVVDRLLASPHYGEQMARHWLDLARYADTHGFNIDSYRDMWRWRDWVIDAYNANMRFDQFTIEQLAGDLLPDPTIDQITATGFNRNHPINDEMGAIAEEYLHVYAADRTNTTASVWMGLTLACAECHDHKYDPISQRDYYQFYAFFNNVDDLGLDGRRGNAAPLLVSPTKAQRDQLAQLDKRIKKRETALATTRDQAAAALTAWEEAQQHADAAGRPPGDYLARFSLDQEEPTLEIERENREPPLFLPGKFDQGVLCDGQTVIRPREAIELGDNWSIGIWFYPTTSSRSVLIAGPRFTLALERGSLVYETSDRHLSTPEAVSKNQWQHAALVVDGKSVTVYYDGQPLPLKESAPVDTMETADLRPEIAQLQFAHAGLADGFRGLLDDIRVYPRALDTLEAKRLSGGDPIGEILAKPAAKRSQDERRTLLDHYLRKHDADYAEQVERYESLSRKRRRLIESFPETMVMRERAERRPAHILRRGRYDSPGEAVLPDVLDCLPGLPAEESPNRLSLARWLMDERHPLTARVAVNRYWQMLFGQPLVATPEDFGLRSQPPSHPELLDHLAVQFVESDWSIKTMVRTIATSRVYRMGTAYDRSSHEADPDNALLWRANPRRLDAEAIRDAMLSISGEIDFERPRGSEVAKAGFTRVTGGVLGNPREIVRLAIQEATRSRGNMRRGMQRGRRNS
ncbi:MAG: DUF1549 domain-containing protein, partial [Blastopirellula sp. JB062]